MIDVKKMYDVPQTAPSLRKKGNILQVLDTLILFQMKYVFRQTNFQDFPGEHAPRPL